MGALGPASHWPPCPIAPRLALLNGLWLKGVGGRQGRGDSQGTRGLVLVLRGSKVNEADREQRWVDM